MRKRHDGVSRRGQPFRHQFRLSGGCWLSRALPAGGQHPGVLARGLPGDSDGRCRKRQRKNLAAGLSAGIDARDGAGALDIDESGQIARSRSSRDNRGEQKGWDVGVFATGDFNAAGDWRHSYWIYVPLATTGARPRVKVALAWNANVIMSRGSIISFWMSSVPADYDLFIHDDKGSMVAWSSSWDNSYEIAKFTGELGRTYTVRSK